MLIGFCFCTVGFPDFHTFLCNQPTLSFTLSKTGKEFEDSQK